MFNFGANHLFLISRTEYPSCAALLHAGPRHAFIWVLSIALLGNIASHVDITSGWRGHQAKPKWVQQLGQLGGHPRLK